MALFYKFNLCTYWNWIARTSIFSINTIFVNVYSWINSICWICFMLIWKKHLMWIFSSVCCFYFCLCFYFFFYFCLGFYFRFCFYFRYNSISALFSWSCCSCFWKGICVISGEPVHIASKHGNCIVVLLSFVKHHYIPEVKVLLRICTPRSKSNILQLRLHIISYDRRQYQIKVSLMYELLIVKLYFFIMIFVPFCCLERETILGLFSFRFIISYLSFKANNTHG